MRLPVQIASHEERRAGRDEHGYLVSENQFVVLRDLAVERIRSAAADGRLRKLANLKGVLYRWQEWGGEAEVKTWLAQETVGMTGALWLLRTFVSVMRSESDKVRFTRYILLNELEAFVSVEAVVQLTDAIDVSSLDESDQRALRAFRQAVASRAEGKPDRYWLDNSFDDNPLTEDS